MYWNRRMTSQGVAMLLGFWSCMNSAGAEVDTPVLGGFLDDARWSVLNRTVYERRDYQHGDKSNGGRNAVLPKAQRSDFAEEWGYGLIGNFESGYTRGLVGLGLDAQAYLAQSLMADDYSVGKIRMLPVDSNGYAQDDIARAGVAFKARISSTVLKIGEQRVKTPVFSSSDSRLLPESMRGALLTSNEFDKLTLQAGHFTGSTDRNSRSTNNALTINYLNPKTARGDAFDLVGGIWKDSQFSVSAYIGRLNDTWYTHYLGGQYTIPLKDKRALAFDVQVYHSKDTGQALAGEIDNTTTSVMASYSHGPHRADIGWQKVFGDTPFDYVSRGAIWLANAAQLSDFNGPNEQSWQVRYELNTQTLGAPGLNLGAAYIRGSGTDGSKISSSSGYSWLGYGTGGKHWERDIWARYTVQSGPAKDLAFLLRYGVHRSNKAQAELNTNQIRLSLEYPIGGKGL
ncbi:imipenem/basic amino acid-specific outer membrane pore [Formivibrio citricus]|uniref:Imipenem/basic amino acid-specific outer membrane pore n=2 Tax=Formivibrio citricus TaxID=83765 RepID=A0A1I5CLB6_9NEIS|nr:imipenem/basic amino acid-specific outer membrane pore [Formivibrio citricus]